MNSFSTSAQKLHKLKLEYDPDQIFVTQPLTLPLFLALSADPSLMDSSIKGEAVAANILLLKEKEALNCFSDKLVISKRLQERKVIHLRNFYDSYLEIAVNWITQLLELHELCDPDNKDFSLRVRLIEKIAHWRYDPQNPKLTSDLNDLFTELEESLSLYYPSEITYTSIWKDLTALLSITCKHKHRHWDPEMSPFELKIWSHKKNNNRQKTNYFLEQIPREDFSLVWRSICMSTFNSWKKIKPLLEDHLVTMRRKVETKLKELSPHDLQLFLEDKPVNDLTLEVLKIVNNELLPALFTLGSTPSSSLHARRKQIITLKLSEERISGYFPKIKRFPLDRNNPYIMLYDAPEKISAIANLQLDGLEFAHSILDIFITKQFVRLGNFWDAAKYDHILKGAFDKEKQLIQEITKDEIKAKPQGKKIVKEISAVAKKKKPSIVAPKEQITAPIELPQIKMLEIPSLKAALPIKASKEMGALAAHTDLYRTLLPAIETLLEHYKEDSTHALNLLRLSYHHMHLLLESLLHFHDYQNDKVPNDLSHNLFAKYKNVKRPIDPSLFKDLYLASHWTRFTRSDLKRWGELSVNGISTPKILEDLTLEVNPVSMKRCIRLLAETNETADLFISKLKGGMQSIPMPTTFSKAIPPDLSDLDNLSGKVLQLFEQSKETSEAGDEWLQQWHDDISCLKSTVVLLHQSQNITEWALLVSHFSTLIHLSIQSPLYVLYTMKFGNDTHEHHLIELWKSVEEINPSILNWLTTYTKNGSVTSRYPFEYFEVQSELHHLQLEAITPIYRPEVLEGFQMASRKRKEETLSINFLPKLEHYSTLEAQRGKINECLSSLCKQILNPLLEKISHSF